VEEEEFAGAGLPDVEEVFARGELVVGEVVVVDE
jgi:hypothetical protein